MSSTNSFNFLFLKRFAHLFHVFLPLSRLSLNINEYEPFYTHPLFLLLLLVINEAGLQVVIYFVGQTTAKFYFIFGKSPVDRDLSAFGWLVLRTLGLVVLDFLLLSLSSFFSSLLYVRWRTRLVLYLHSLYFTQQRFYHLLNTTQENENLSNYSIQTTIIDESNRESVDYVPTVNSNTLVKKKTLIDNPDQRITQDVDSLCRSLSLIIPILVVSPFSIVYYTYRTWLIAGYYGPLGVFLFFLIWTFLYKIFISLVSRTIFRQDIVEGNFRFLHTQIRTYHEPIAFYHGASFEHKRFDNYFLTNLVPILYRRTWQELCLNISTNSFDYLGSVVSYSLLGLAVFVLHFYDNVEPSQYASTLSASSFIIMQLIYSFSKLNDINDKLTVIAANTHRVQTFVEFMKNLHLPFSDRDQINRTTSQNEVLTIKNLSYSTPMNSKHILMQNLNLTLYQGERLLITGDSGVGKTSLFRVLHSLWPVNITGSFSYQIKATFLLPQRPYFTNLSLHDELSYPDKDKEVTMEGQEDILRALQEWNLTHLLDCVESNVFTSPKYPWQDLLSPGELQRLSFLRLVLRLSPRYSQTSPRLTLVFLDEISSSLDTPMEMKMYQYLLTQNLALISIGHRDSLKQYHQQQLKLYQNGRFTLEMI